MCANSSIEHFGDLGDILVQEAVEDKDSVVGCIGQCLAFDSVGGHDFGHDLHFDAGWFYLAKQAKSGNFSFS